MLVIIVSIGILLIAANKTDLFISFDQSIKLLERLTLIGVAFALLSSYLRPSNDQPNDKKKTRTQWQRFGLIVRVPFSDHICRLL